MSELSDNQKHHQANMGLKPRAGFFDDVTPEGSDENKLLCSVCYAKADLQAYGNTYCKKCYEGSPYYAERAAKVRIEKERNG